MAIKIEEVIGNQKWEDLGNLQIKKPMMKLKEL